MRLVSIQICFSTSKGGDPLSPGAIAKANDYLELNRLCDPDSKLSVLRWLQTVALPDIEVKTVTHQQLLRSMDALIDTPPFGLTNSFPTGGYASWGALDP